MTYELENALSVKKTEGKTIYVFADGIECHVEKNEPTPQRLGSEYIRWYKNGKLHRENGPAIENEIVGRQWSKAWYQNGKRHRVDGPAYMDSSGDRQWYKHGKRHHIDGPAVEYRNGGFEWYKNGKLHRNDGPAVILTNPNEDHFLEIFRWDDCLFGRLYVNCTFMLWFKNGKLHREDGPAYMDSDGRVVFFKNGKPEQRNGPNMFRPNCTLFFFDEDFNQLTRENGGPSQIQHNAIFWKKGWNYHRVDGPAIENDDGRKEWYINNKNITQAVTKWLNDNQISYPFTPEEQTFFLITFGEHQR